MIAAALLLAAKLTPGLVAMSLESSPADRASLLHQALSDDDATVRAAAARVVAVTNAGDLLGDVRAALSKETDADAAREEVGAIGMSGGVKELDALLAASKKFNSILDPFVQLAVARGGGPDAVAPLLSSRSVGLMPYALLGENDAVIGTTARILGKGDARLWEAWLRELRTADLPLDPKIAAVALAHPNRAIAEATAWQLAAQYAGDPPADPKPLLKILDQWSDYSLAGEVLARALGRDPRERDEWLAWIPSPEGKEVLRPLPAWLLTASEQKAAGRTELATRPPKRDPAIRHIYGPPFTVMDDLPKGVTAGVMEATQCDGNWLGAGTVQIDHAGRVTKVDVPLMGSSPACGRALEVMVRLSLAEEEKLGVPLVDPRAVFAHQGTVENCFDESSVADNPTGRPVRAGGDVKAPVKYRSVEPLYPEESRRARESGIVIIETRINTHGCIGSMSIVKPLTPRLNTAALLAVSQWRYLPGTLDGHPVDVISNLTVNFKLK